MSMAISSIQVTAVSTSVQARKAVEGAEPSSGGIASATRTQVTIGDASAEVDGDDDANKALAELLASPPLVALKYVTPADQRANMIEELSSYSVQPRETANTALLKVNSELKKVQDKIELNRPSMLGKKWDFVLKDGKIQVVNDNLNAKDHQWLENVLNKDKSLVSAVSDFYGAVTKYYDHTSDHPSATMRNGNGQEAGFVYDAASQINGKLAVRDIMDKTIASLSRPNGVLMQDRRKPFFDSIELSRDYFKSEAIPKFHLAKLDRSDAVTAQYFKDHPNTGLY